MEATTTAVLSTFSVILGQEEGDRRLAEQQLTALEVLDTFPVILVNLTADERVPVEIRQLSGITLKHYVATHWDETGCQEFKPPQTTDEAKGHVRASLLHTLCSPVRLVRTTAAHTITAIAQYDWPEFWPTLLPDLTEMLNTVTTTEDEKNKALVHGVMRVLADMSGEISDLDIPKVAPILMPSLVRMLSDKQHFGNATRRNAVLVITNLVDTVISLGDHNLFHLHIGQYLHPILDALLTDLASNSHLLIEASYESSLIQLLTTFCVDVPKFVTTYINGGFPRLMNILWQLLLRITETYVRYRISVRQSGACGDELEDADDLVDSDGETVEVENMAYAILEFLSRLVNSKRYRAKLGTCLPDVCFQLARLLQLPEETISRWSTSIGDFLEESEELHGYSVRLTAMDVIRKVSSHFPSWSMAFRQTVDQLFRAVEAGHANSDPGWWKQLEVALYLCGSFPKGFSVDASDSNSNSAELLSTTANVQVDHVYTTYVLPSLRQTGLPFLQVAALRCATQLTIQGPPSSSRLDNLPAVLVDALSPTQHIVLRATVVRSLGNAGTRLRRAYGISDTDPNQMAIRSQLVSHLPSLVSGVIDCLSSFGEPLLDDGLNALYSLLRIDPQGFTLSAHTQISTILVGLFKHCLSVASTMELYLDVIRAVQQAGSKSCADAVEQAFMPTLLTCLEQQDSVESVAIEAALHILCVLVQGSSHNLSDLLIQRLFPAVVHIAITSSDAMIISGCCEVLRSYLAMGVDRVLEWHDDEGNNGISYILHVTSRLLDPSSPVEWAVAAGRLVCAILLRLNSQQLGENLDLLLRGTLARLSTLPLSLIGQSGPGRALYTLDDENINTAGLGTSQNNGARLSLLFVFIVLFRMQPDVAINFLASVPDLSGQPVMAKVLRLWCAYQPFYFSRYEIRISVLALSNLLMHAITTKDSRLMEMTTDEIIENDDSASIAARTRTKQDAQQCSVIKVPLIVKVYKLLINELAKKLEEEDEEEEESEQSDTGDDEAASEMNNQDMNQTSDYNSTFPIIEEEDESDNSTNDDDIQDDPIYSRDPAMKVDLREHLCTLFHTLAEQPFYNEFSRYHTETELATLRQSGVVQIHTS
ncbi:unnamed protein product [Calicophoron daubneyi]|uniref:Importin N-terminal domain-containing protein n=1 Tax=Calicophoron daubneyi TaxID=300641 RepID=A0AAV2TUE3_CALDB